MRCSLTALAELAAVVPDDLMIGPAVTVKSVALTANRYCTPLAGLAAAAPDDLMLDMSCWTPPLFIVSQIYAVLSVHNDMLRK